MKQATLFCLSLFEFLGGIEGVKCINQNEVLPCKKKYFSILVMI